MPGHLIRDRHVSRDLYECILIGMFFREVLISNTHPESALLAGMLSKMKLIKLHSEELQSLVMGALDAGYCLRS